MKILIINGPNLNLLGKREVDVYGNRSFEGFLAELRQRHSGLEVDYFQSNHEGAIIDKLHEVGFSQIGIVMNGGALTHTSIALADAVAAIEAPVVEVHISNTFAREAFRHESLTARNAKGVIIGCGMEGYHLAVLRIKELLGEGK